MDTEAGSGGDPRISGRGEAVVDDDPVMTLGAHWDPLSASGTAVRMSTPIHLFGLTHF
jgi:hypothetical protein